MHPISAIVVTHNSAAVIGECLAALHDVEQIAVVDNNSVDSTVSYVCSTPGVRLIGNRTNRGFAAGVNQGVRETTSPYLLILNPDAVLLDDLSPLIQRAAQCGVAAGRLVDSDGTTQTGFTIRRFPTAWALAFEVLGLTAIWPTNPINRAYRYLDRDSVTSGPVEQPAGAFLMVRRDVFEELHGFDEGYYPVWFEDVDFCRRAKEIGYTFWYESGVRARHTGAHSVRGIAPQDRAGYWYGGLLRYAGKYLPRPQFRAVSMAVAAGSVLRMLVEPILKRSGKPIAAYGKIVRLALSCALSGRPPIPRNVCAEIEDEGPNGLSHPER